MSQLLTPTQSPAANHGLPEAEVNVRRPRRFLDSRVLWATVCAAVIFTLWEIAGRTEFVNPTFTSYPTEVAQAAVDYFKSGVAWDDLKYTGQEFALGFVLAVLIGVPIGLVMGAIRKLDAALDPVLSFLNASPLIAFAPLFVLWFGIGVTSKVALVTFVAAIPIVVSARAGVLGADRELLTMARSWNASTLYVARTIILPGAVPSVAAGIRLGVGYALHGVVLGEFIAAYGGVGFRINAATQTLNTGLMFACVFLISGLGVLVTELAGLAERRFSRWRL